jgi:AcrR family transcriptional regulator
VGGTRCPPPSCTVTHGRPQAPRPPLAVSTRCFVLGSTAASRTVLRREGLPETTLERIADAAGVSRATIYRRGVSRDQLIDALTARAADEFRRALWPALSGADTAGQRLRLALEAICAVADEHLDLLAGMFPAHGEVFHRPARTP